MLKFYLSLVFYLFLMSGVFAQERCASPSYKKYLKDKHLSIAEGADNLERLLQTRSLSNARTQIEDTLIHTISVVVHVIHKNSSGSIGGTGNTNISEEQVLSQIQTLNEDYRRKAGTAGFNTDTVGADTHIQFCLAGKDSMGLPTSGIVRIYNSKSSWDPSSDDQALKSLSHWPSEKYLNLYVTDLGSDFLGYAQFPYDAGLPGYAGEDPGSATDGVVIDYTAFGRVGTVKNPYHLGRTATHEIGHWLGLNHVWGDAYCGEDYVSDTPLDEKPNNDFNCLDSSKCSGTGYVKDMTNNYLDYSPDGCMNIFTKGQRERMRSVIQLSNRRKSVVQNPACNDVLAVQTQEDFSDMLHAYPNPATEIIYYQLNFEGVKDVRVQLCNFLGQVVYDEVRKKSEKFKNEILLNFLPTGIYLLKTQIGARTKVLKFIVEK